MRRWSHVAAKGMRVTELKRQGIPKTRQADMLFPQSLKIGKRVEKNSALLHERVTGEADM